MPDTHWREYGRAARMNALGIPISPTLRSGIRRTGMVL
jgi:hypothetical protein